MAIAWCARPAGLSLRDQGNDARVGEPDSSRKDGAADDDSSMVDQHDVPRLSEPDRMSGWTEKFLGIDHPTEHADRFIAETVHNRKADGERIRVRHLVKIHVFDIQLTDAFVERALPP